MKWPFYSSLILFLLLVSTSIYGQHTFSIVAVDPATGEIGSAGATCLDIDDLGGEEGALVISDIILGIGAINTQAFWSPVNQNAARTRMEMGDSPQQIIDWLIANDPASGTINSRQYGVVDLLNGIGGTPRSAAFTGSGNSSVANDITGPNYSIQGNILISQAVLDDMETGFLNTSGTLADKLMAAMQGAKRIGADNRCTSNQTSSKSAFLRVAKIDDLYSNYGHLTVDLNVSKTNFAEDPIDILQDTYNFYLSNPGTNCTTTVSSFPYAESFESGLGLWTQNDMELSQVGNTDFDWTINSGSTPTANTGPSSASDGSSYIYTEASGNNVGNPTKRAVLNSPCFDFTNETGINMTFDYHIFGSNIGNLAIRVNNGSGWNTIWLLDETQGNQWNTVTLSLNDYINQTIQLRIDSTTGIGVSGDIAVDNLIIEQALSIEEQENLDTVDIYPNPTTKFFTIKSQGIDINRAEIYDVHGRLIISKTVNSENHHQVDISNIMSGVYFVKLISDTGYSIKQLVKK